MESMTWIEWLRAGGVWSPTIILAALASLGAIAVAWGLALRSGPRSSARVAGVIGLLGSSLPGTQGLAGWQLDLAQMERALPLVAPDMVDLFITQGHQAALVPLQLGGALSVLLAALAATALAMTWRRPAVAAASTAAG